MIRRTTLPLLALLPPLLLPPLPATAADTGAEAGADGRLPACLKQARARPVTALEQALAWQERGGGGPARLCRAMALFHKEAFAEAAAELEALVPELGAGDPAAAASLLGRAGWAWLRAGVADRAERAYTAAIAEQPDDPDLRIDRAFARAEVERYWDAIADLDDAIARAPQRADAWFYRAAAHKALTNYRQAIDDVARALELRPGDGEAVLLRGNLKALSGDLDGARADWRLVGDLAPDSAAARAAAINLDRTAPATEAKSAPPPAATPAPPPAATPAK